MKNIEVLQKARAAISTPETWTRYVRSDGNRSHCALGAFEVALNDIISADNHPAVALLAASLTAAEREVAQQEYKRMWGGEKLLTSSSLVAQFNNGSRHENVLAVFDRAIERQRLIDQMQNSVSAVVAETVE